LTPYVQHTHTHTHTHTLPFYGSGFCLRQPGEKHSPTHTCHGHQSSLILHLLQSMTCSLFNLHACQFFFSQSLSKFSLVCLLAWHPPLHTPYISSPNHCLHFCLCGYYTTSSINCPFSTVRGIFLTWLLSLAVFLQLHSELFLAYL